MNAGGKKQRNIMGEIDDTQKEINDLIAATKKKTSAKGKTASAPSKDQYEVLKEAFAAGICVYRDGKIEEANTVLASMLGFDVSELYGLDPLSFIEQVDMDKLVTKMKKGDEEPCEVEVIRKDGSSFYAWVEVKNIEFKGDPATALTVFDITDYVEVRAELMEEVAFLEDIFNGLPDTFYVSDLGGRLMRWNKALELASGYSDDELSEMLVTDFIAKEDLPKVGQAISEAFDTGMGRVVEVTAVSKDGRRIPYEFYGGVLQDTEGNPIGICGIGRNVINRRRDGRVVELERDLALRVTEANGLPQVFEFCLEAVLKATGLDSGGIYLHDHKTGAFEMVRCIGLSEPFVLAAKHISPDSGDATEIKSGKPVYRVHEMLAVSKDGAEINERLRCLALVPIFHDDVLLGCLSVTSHTLEEISNESKAIIEALIEQIGRHINWAQRIFTQQVYQKISKYLLNS